MYIYIPHRILVGRGRSASSRGPGWRLPSQTGPDCDGATLQRGAGSKIYLEAWVIIYIILLIIVGYIYNNSNNNNSNNNNNIIIIIYIHIYIISLCVSTYIMDISHEQQVLAWMLKITRLTVERGEDPECCAGKDKLGWRGWHGWLMHHGSKYVAIENGHL